MTEPGIELFVKAGPSGTDRGDCPFSQKAAMCLVKREVPFKETPVDISNKPQWFLDMTNQGTTPVLRHNDVIVKDSKEIVEYVAKNLHGNNSRILSAEAAMAAVAPFMKHYVAFFKTATDDEAKAAFEAQLQNLDTFLKTEKKPFFDGEEPTAADFVIIPQLYAAKVALAHWHKYTFPSELDALSAYMQRAFSHNTFTETTCPDEYIIKGWGKKLGH